MRAVLLCIQCSADCGHTWHPALGQWRCEGCGLARWPAALPVDDLEALAVERTGPIALPPVAAPVVGEEDWRDRLLDDVLRGKAFV